MAAFGADIRNVRQSGQNNSWSKLDLFRYSSPGVRDFTDGQDGLPAYFSVDGNTLLLQFHNQWNGNTHVDTGDPGDFQVLDPFGFDAARTRPARSISATCSTPGSPIWPTARRHRA